MKRTIFAIFKIKPHIPAISKCDWRLFLVSGLFLSHAVTGCYYKTVEFTSLEDPVLEDCKIISAEDKHRGRVTFNYYGARYHRDGGGITVLSAEGDTFNLAEDQIDKLITSEVQGQQFVPDSLPNLASVLLNNSRLIFAGDRGFYFEESNKELICFTDRDNSFSANLSEIKEFYYAKHSFITPQQLTEQTVPAVKKVILKDSDLAIPVKMILHDRGNEYIAGVSNTSEKIIIPGDDLISLEAEMLDEEATTLVWVLSGITTAVLVVLFVQQMDKAFSGMGRDIRFSAAFDEHAISGSGR
ncbi:MAG: hypothetical protein HRU80_03050 [Ignavibacteriales bacterium]|nr:MAG: hypothetical protein HRU80_03050 [Ignavibacteriales bacterium]